MPVNKVSLLTALYRPVDASSQHSHDFTWKDPKLRLPLCFGERKNFFSFRRRAIELACASARVLQPVRDVTYRPCQDNMNWPFDPAIVSPCSHRPGRPSPPLAPPPRSIFVPPWLTFSPSPRLCADLAKVLWTWQKARGVGSLYRLCSVQPSENHSEG